MNFPRTRTTTAAALCICLLYLLLLPLRRREPVELAYPDAADSSTVENKPKTTQEIKVDVVVASLAKEDTSWLYKHFPEWQKKIYVVDDKTAPLTVTENKGHETMAYLTCVYHYFSH